MTNILWFLGIYPGDPHNLDAIVLYTAVVLVGLLLLTFFGFLGTKQFRDKMKAMNRWLSSHTDSSPNLVFDPHKPLAEVMKQHADIPPWRARLRVWYYIQAAGVFLVLLIIIVYLLAHSK